MTRGASSGEDRAVVNGVGESEVERMFALGQRVTKRTGSSWTGKVVGFYSTALTPIGYAVESENEPGSVQIYPEAALTTPAPAVSRDEAIEQIVVGFSDKAILRLDIDEDDPRLSLICDEMRCDTRAILSRIRGEAE
jgi:hypothetical protein